MAELVVADGRTRRRRWTEGAPAAVDAWPLTWRALAGHWLRREASRAKWNSLLAIAGSEGFDTAHDLFGALLEGGWIVVDEAWRGGRWLPLWVEFCDLRALRHALGVPEPGAKKAAQETARTELLAALERWNEEPTSPTQATRRDFALFARGNTKGISAAEWKWLETQTDLAACGIGEHTPLLCIAAPLVLETPRGKVDLAAGDFLGLPPKTMTSTVTTLGFVRTWTLIENRTSFERHVLRRDIDEGVIWLPGFPPGWWQIAITRLLALAPAPARIACDPDPAGIEIALAAGRHWDTAGLPWTPWRMDTADLAALALRKPLTERDEARLEALGARTLPPPLRALADWLLRNREKGEQEGYL